MWFYFIAYFWGNIRCSRNWKQFFTPINELLGRASVSPFAGRDWGRVCPECWGKMTLLILGFKTTSKMHIQSSSCVESGECALMVWEAHTEPSLKLRLTWDALRSCCAYTFYSKNSFYLCVKTHWEAQSCWHSFALPAWDPPEMEQGWPRASRVQGSNDWQRGRLLPLFQIEWSFTLLLQICGNPGWERYISKVDPKHLLPDCELKPSNKWHLCTGEKITYNFHFPDTWMAIFFFLGKFVSKIIVWIKT